MADKKLKKLEFIKLPPTDPMLPEPVELGGLWISKDKRDSGKTVAVVRTKQTSGTTRVQVCGPALYSGKRWMEIDTLRTRYRRVGEIYTAVNYVEGEKPMLFMELRGRALHGATAYQTQAVAHQRMLDFQIEHPELADALV